MPCILTYSSTLRQQFGVTSDVSGTLNNMDESVLFDFFILIHELGHSLGSGHTFDAYDPPIDQCGPCVIPGQGESLAIDGLPLESSSVIMSYCNFCIGGLSNIAFTLGGEWEGEQPRSELETWQDNHLIVGDVSKEPRRVSHTIWQRLASKGECVAPPLERSETQGCNEHSDCDDVNECTVDVCESNVCIILETMQNCCGNGMCELGERDSCVLDCGPFTIKPESFCEDCFELDGFMFDVGLDNQADRRVFISSVRFMHSAPANETATVDLYITEEGTYKDKVEPTQWEKIASSNVSTTDKSDFAEIQLDSYILLDSGSRRGFYLAASENIILFEEGVYSSTNDQGVELYSSRAVSGLFGDGIDGFSLSIEIHYLLDDRTMSPTKMPADGHETTTSDLESTSVPAGDNVQSLTTTSSPMHEHIASDAGTKQESSTASSMIFFMGTLRKFFVVTILSFVSFAW